MAFDSGFSRVRMGWVGLRRRKGKEKIGSESERTKIRRYKPRGENGRKERKQGGNESKPARESSTSRDQKRKGKGKQKKDI